MVKLTFEYVQTCKKKNQSKIINRTHLFVSSRQISKIGDLTKLSHVTVMYLHNNCLNSIDGLACMINLTQLHLEWNSIDSIDNLNNLPNLRNLYLGYNRIAALDGLKGMPSLKLLHCQRQKLTDGKTQNFNTDTLTQLSQSLTELNVSGNGITSVEKLKLLKKLTHLDISHNLITNLSEFCAILPSWRRLKSLQIRENPFTKSIKYECDIIVSSSSLDTLNGKPVSSTTRAFLHALAQMRSKQERRKQTEKRIGFSSETQSFVYQLPPEFREIVSRSIILNKRQ